MIIELIISSLICPPYVDLVIKGIMLEGEYEYSWDSIVNILCLARTYTFYRLFAYFSIWTNTEAAQMYKKTCKRKISPFFLLKAELSFNPLRFIAISLLISLTYFAIAIRRFEDRKSTRLNSSHSG